MTNTFDPNLLPALSFEASFHGSSELEPTVGPECVVIGLMLGLAINRKAAG